MYGFAAVNDLMAPEYIAESAMQFFLSCLVTTSLLLHQSVK
jgi:hypothetical protein